MNEIVCDECEDFGKNDKMIKCQNVNKRRSKKWVIVFDVIEQLEMYPF